MFNCRNIFRALDRSHHLPCLNHLRDSTIQRLSCSPLRPNLGGRGGDVTVRWLSSHQLALKKKGSMSSLPTVPSDFYQKLEEKFDSAVESESLIYNPATQIPYVDSGLQFVFSLVPGLAKKPSGFKESNSEGKNDPFTTIDPSLVVLDTFADDYQVALNKFAVQKGHFLLITKQAISQSSILTEEDLEASYALLRSANAQSGRRHIGFYNCGKLSGASVDHKHVQFMALPETVTSDRSDAVSFPQNKFVPFPDDVIAGKRDSFKGDEDPLRESKLPINHYIMPIPSNYVDTPDLIHMRFAGVISRALTVFVKAEREKEEQGLGEALRPQDLSYNVIFTEEWVLVVPRRQEKFGELSVNSVGMIGLLLAKSEEQLESYKQVGPIKLLENLAYPYEQIDFGTGDHDMLYTRY